MHNIGDMVEVDIAGLWNCAEVTAIDAEHGIEAFTPFGPRRWYALDAVRKPPTAEPSPLAPPIIVNVYGHHARSPFPVRCSASGCYGAVQRERGEVRVWHWRCGCAVVPASVERQTIIRVDDDGVARRPAEPLWEAWGHGAWAQHPTASGAIAAWRVALGKRQEADDAEAERAPISGIMRTIARDYIVKRWAERADAPLDPQSPATATYDGVNDVMQAMTLGTALTGLAPNPDGTHSVAISIGGAPWAGKAAAAERFAAAAGAVYARSWVCWATKDDLRTTRGEER